MCAGLCRCRVPSASQLNEGPHSVHFAFTISLESLRWNIWLAWAHSWEWGSINTACDQTAFMKISACIFYFQASVALQQIWGCDLWVAGQQGRFWVSVWVDLSVCASLLCSDILVCISERWNRCVRKPWGGLCAGRVLMLPILTCVK